MNNNKIKEKQIKLLISISALFHDIGKINTHFQNKLKNSIKNNKNDFLRDKYRHEWISVKIFEAILLLIKNQQTSNEENNNFSLLKNGLENFYSLLLTGKEEFSIGKEKTSINSDLLKNKMIKAIFLLIVTHHKLIDCYSTNSLCYETKNLKIEAFEDCFLYKNNSDKEEDFFLFNNVFNKTIDKESNNFKFFSNNKNKKLFLSKIKKIISLLKEMKINNTTFILNLKDIILAKTFLMLGDYSISSQKRNIDNSKSHNNEDNKPNYNYCIANTMVYKNGNIEDIVVNQYLDEHLLKVSDKSVELYKEFLKNKDNLSTLKEQNFEPSLNDKFKWQDNVVENLNNISKEMPFFGINMASTGCGKTFCNAKIMSKISNRYSIALGLRTLTKQTGEALQEKLKLNNEEISILIGGEKINQTNENFNPLEEKSEYFLSHYFEENIIHNNNNNNNNNSFIEKINFLNANDKIKHLIQSSLLVCTIDHLISCSESIKGGKGLIPLLRLMTSDLVLDEPDDFSLNDLPTLSRLCFLAGLFNSKILLSSATLTPSLINMLFEAYVSGLKEHFKNEKINLQLFWCDEFNVNNEQITIIEDLKEEFYKKHENFVATRIYNILNSFNNKKGKILKIKEIVEEKLKNPPSDEEKKEIIKKRKENFYQQIFEEVMDLHLKHSSNYQSDEVNNKKISTGLIRFDNIKTVIECYEYFYQKLDETGYGYYEKEGNSEKIKIKFKFKFNICVYHSKYPKGFRNKIEEKLDLFLNKKDKINFTLSDEEEQIYLVIASPVAEVGRDHDYDYAIIEPSSMRSIIQTAGRVLRHRTSLKITEPNVVILSKNHKDLEKITINNPFQKKEEVVIFANPGYETKDNVLKTHDLTNSDIFLEDYIKDINSKTRISSEEFKDFVKLEHESVKILSNQDLIKDFYTVDGFFKAEIRKFSIFRKNEEKTEKLIMKKVGDIINFYSIDNGKETIYSNPVKFRYKTQDKKSKCLQWIKEDFLGNDEISINIDKNYEFSENFGFKVNSY